MIYFWLKLNIQGQIMNVHIHAQCHEEAKRGHCPLRSDLFQFITPKTILAEGDPPSETQWPPQELWMPPVRLSQCRLWVYISGYTHVFNSEVLPSLGEVMVFTLTFTLHAPWWHCLYAGGFRTAGQSLPWRPVTLCMHWTTLDCKPRPQDDEHCNESMMTSQ